MLFDYGKHDYALSKEEEEEPWRKSRRKIGEFVVSGQ